MHYHRITELTELVEEDDNTYSLFADSTTSPFRDCWDPYSQSKKRDFGVADLGEDDIAPFKRVRVITEKKERRPRQPELEVDETLAPLHREHKSAKELKLEAAKQRELEAKAYMMAMREAKAKGLPMPGFDRVRRDFRNDGVGTREQEPDRA
jgi:hypothetical protein